MTTMVEVSILCNCIELEAARFDPLSYILSTGHYLAAFTQRFSHTSSVNKKSNTTKLISSTFHELAHPIPVLVYPLRVDSAVTFRPDQKFSRDEKTEPMDCLERRKHMHTNPRARDDFLMGSSCEQQREGNAS